ncbi:MAG: SDR family oxidoreductase [Bacteroidota bacterium]
MKGKVAIVTGSSMGIGKAIARQLGQSGAQVVLNARNAEKLEITRKELLAEGLDVAAFAADVSSVKEVEQLMEFCLQTYGKIDILINNAGVATRGSVENLAPDVFQKVMDVNVLGSIFPSKAALPYLRQSKGHLIFISSIAAFHGLPYNSVYCASKKALIAFSESLRLEEKRNQVHVGIAYVGFTENDPKKIIMDSDGKLMYLEARQGIKKQSPEQVAQIIQRMIRTRKNSVTLSLAGKSLRLVQRWFPWIISMIYTKNMDTIRANSEGKPTYVPKAKQ